MYDAFMEVAGIINPSNSIQYAMADILDFDNSFLASHVALAAKQGEDGLDKKFSKNEMMMAEVAKMMLDEEVWRPIKDREAMWRETGNVVPFDR